MPKAERCRTCGGSGAEPGTSPIVCPRCEGRGVDAQSQGFFSISQPCPQCGGAGQVIEHPCATCGGSGLTHQTKRYKVNIPAGVKDGTRIRLAGRGEAGPRGGPPGDLYVTTRVTPSPVFKRLDDGNLEVVVPITISEAIGGGTVEVPTLNGTKRIRVPAGTQHGTIQRLRGEGPAADRRPRPPRHPLPAGDRDPRGPQPRAGAGPRGARATPSTGAIRGRGCCAAAARSTREGAIVSGRAEARQGGAGSGTRSRPRSTPSAGSS